MTGNRVAGDVRDVPDSFGRMLLDNNLAEVVEVIEASPFPASGQVKQSASLPVAQVSPCPMLSTSEVSVESLPLTPASKLPSGVTQSMPVTEHGGTDTTVKPRKGRRGGRKTKTQQVGTD